MNYKKVLAGVLAGTMVMGNAAVAFADDQKGSTTGTGTLDVVEKSDVFAVVLPTIPDDGDTTFNYILDPTGVIKDTEGAKYNGATFAEGKTVFFANAGSGGATTYSDTSDALEIENKSTMAVDVTVKASIKPVSGITMSNTDTFDADDTAAKLYLALKDTEATPNVKAITADTGAELTASVPALEDAYETKYVDGKYVKQLKADATGFKKYSFQVTGACNPKGAWSGLKDTPPEIDVVWSVKDPTITGPQVSMNTSGVITFSNLLGADYVSMSLNDGEKDWPLTNNDGKWGAWEDAEDGQKEFTLGANWITFLKGKTAVITVSLKDGSSITSAEVEMPE